MKVKLDTKSLENPLAKAKVVPLKRKTKADLEKEKAKKKTTGKKK